MIVFTGCLFLNTTTKYSAPRKAEEYLGQLRNYKLLKRNGILREKGVVYVTALTPTQREGVFILHICVT